TLQRHTLLLERQANGFSEFSRARDGVCRRLDAVHRSDPRRHLRPRGDERRLAQWLGAFGVLLRWPGGAVFIDGPWYQSVSWFLQKFSQALAQGRGHFGCDPDLYWPLDHERTINLAGQLAIHGVDSECRRRAKRQVQANAADGGACDGQYKLRGCTRRRVSNTRGPTVSTQGTPGPGGVAELLGHVLHPVS